MVSTSYCGMKIYIRDCTYNDSCNYYLKFIYGYPEKYFLKTLCSIFELYQRSLCATKLAHFIQHDINS